LRFAISGFFPSISDKIGNQRSTLMLDDFSKRSKAVRAAFALAERRNWGDITLADIAQAAGLDLSELRREFSCKADIVRAFQKEVDAEVLAKERPAGEAQSPRDRVFDIVMTRFEVMQPYKPALKRISDYLCCRPGEAAAVLCSSLASQYWMLAGAGAKLDGPGGALRVTGLASIYAKVFQVWLGDTSPSLDKTMAALDKRLARGERMLSAIEQGCADACRLACAFVPPGWRRKSEPAEGPVTPPSQPVPPHPA
jgi:AcrR family transcriptional regulator